MANSSQAIAAAVAHVVEHERLAEQLEVDEQRRVVRVTAAVGERVGLGEVLERRR